MKKNKFYMKHNSFTEDMPIVVIFKAMGIQCDQEILQMIGSEEMMASAMIPCFEECHQHQVFTQLQVITSP